MKTKLEIQIIIILIIVGFLAGLFSCMFGIGGGVILVSLIGF